MLKETNEKYGYYDDFYVFISSTRKRITANGIDKRLKTLCQKNDTPFRSLHKIRKTYISTLIDSNININMIRELIGHRDERTTYNSYCFNRFTDPETEIQMEHALQL